MSLKIKPCIPKFKTCWPTYDWESIKWKMNIKNYVKHPITFTSGLVCIFARLHCSRQKVNGGICLPNKVLSLHLLIFLPKSCRYVSFTLYRWAFNTKKHFYAILNYKYMVSIMTVSYLSYENKNQFLDYSNRRRKLAIKISSFKTKLADNVNMFFPCKSLYKFKSL